LVLLPLAGVYGAAMTVRLAAYRGGLFSIRRLPLPTVAVGNLVVGGTGKTPIAAWIAAHYAGRGLRPGILLRGYGGDETLVHQRLVREAIVVANPDRVAGAERARSLGATVLVLDDAFQLLGVARDLNVLVVSAEGAEAAPWLLPAGPWRERWSALERANVIVVTRKRIGPEEAGHVGDRLGEKCPRALVAVANLGLDRFDRMSSGGSVQGEALAGRRVLVAAGIADPETFAAQVAGFGAKVQLQPYQDHHPYSAADVARLVQAAQSADYVVVTEKDAVKLRGRWPAPAGAGGEPLVAALGVHWERNGHLFEQALDAAVRPTGVPVSEA